MSKGNLFLGKARGRIGSVVLYELDGEQRARAWQPVVRNPRTWRQAVQRVIAKTAYVAYSSLLTLCRQSYQGAAAGTPSQTEFYRRNYRILKDRVLQSYDAGEDAVLEDATANYNGLSDHVMLLNPLMVSDGGLSSMGARVTDGGLLLPSSGLGASATYADVCDAYGLSQDDTLDVLMLRASAGGVVDQIAHCRIVMRPQSGVMSTAFVAAGGSVNDPNEGNFGVVGVSVGEGGLTLFGRLVPNAGAVVRSHMLGGLRQLSPEWIALPADVSALSDYTIGRAVASITGAEVYLDGAVVRPDGRACSSITGAEVYLDGG